MGINIFAKQSTHIHIEFLPCQTEQKLKWHVKNYMFTAYGFGETTSSLSKTLVTF